MAKKEKQLGAHLWARDGSQFYWFRMAVPVRYRHVVGKAKIQESLQTANLAEARRLRTLRKDQLVAEWRSLAFERIDDSTVPASHIEPIERFKPLLQDLEEAAVAVGFDIHLEEARQWREGLLSYGDWAYDISRQVAVSEQKRQSIANASGDLSLVEPKPTWR